MHSNNQNRQISSTGAVPKTGTKKETQRDVVSRVVAPIVRETPNQNISSYNMVSLANYYLFIFGQFKTTCIILTQFIRTLFFLCFNTAQM